MTLEEADVIIIGLGAMGLAAAYQCARRGLRVIGLEQFELGHERGSSHGKSRVIRKAYFEDPRYVPLLHSAYDEWRNMEKEPGQTLLNLVGCLNMGPPTHEAIRGVQASVREYNLPHEMLTSRQIRDRWPFFTPAPDDIGIFEADGGFICPELAQQEFTRLALAHGARLVDRAIVRQWAIDESRCVVATESVQYTASQLVITAGGWLPVMVPELRRHLTIERQVQAWFQPRQPEAFAKSNMPSFIHFSGEDGFYGIPPADPSIGIKIARHHGGAIGTADEIDRHLHPEDEADIRGFIRRHMPAADGPLLDAKICLYTNTPDSHFILDRHPAHSNVWIAGGFSGHGFKFSPLVGRILAELCTEGRTAEPIELFAISRLA